MKLKSRYNFWNLKIPYQLDVPTFAFRMLGYVSQSAVLESQLKMV